MSTDQIRPSALLALTEGHVRVLEARTDGADERPVFVEAYVTGRRGGRVLVRLREGEWRCFAHLSADCVHCEAVRLVTGYANEPAQRGTR